MQKEELLKYRKRSSQRENLLMSLAEFEEEYEELPKWAQSIVLQDIKTAIKSRMVIMQKACTSLHPRTKACTQIGN